MTIKLQISAGIQIQKSIQEVFEAIVNPNHMCHYFIGRSSGKMEEGKDIIWGFPEMEEDVDIKVGKIVENKYVSFEWKIGDLFLLVEIQLTERSDGSTIVKISEKEMENDEKGIAWLKGNTEGWANFLACLKAYLEYGINLRKGAFLYRFENK